LIHLILQVVQLFMLDDAISEVVLVVEQVFDRDGLEPLSACDVSGK
jgi:hypothetical protein